MPRSTAARRDRRQAGPDEGQRSILLDTEQAADHVDLRPSTLATWRHQGKGPVFLKVGSKVRYRLADLEGWLSEQARTSTSDPGPEPEGG